MNFEQTPEFARDLKQLKKRWRSLSQDIVDAERAIVPLYVTQEGVDIQVYRRSVLGTKRATILQAGDGYEVVKMRLDCATLGNSNKTRLVFVAVVAEDTVKLVELFAKNTNEREDARRIKRYLP